MTKALAHKIKLIDQLGSIQNTHILDYGCGQGDFVELFLNMNPTPRTIMAVDSNSSLITNIQQNFAKEITKNLVLTKVCQSPKELLGLKFDKIICHNVLECVENKIDFINDFSSILANKGTAIISHHDFDSAIYNSSYMETTRELVHHFSDTQQSWQEHCDGQVGRKIPGLIASSIFKEATIIETIRIVETEFKPGNYGFLMAQMITDIAKTSYDNETLKSWILDLEEKNQHYDYYFAIDLVIANLTHTT